MRKLNFNEERLRKLANHLLHGQLSFDILPIKSRKITIQHKTHQVEVIPILGYPILELTSIFPDDWMIGEKNQPFWIKDWEQETISSIKIFFGITDQMMAHVFCPEHQMPFRFRGNVLMNDAKPEDVAKNILDLIDAVKFYSKQLKTKQS